MGNSHRTGHVVVWHESVSETGVEWRETVATLSWFGARCEGKQKPGETRPFDCSISKQPPPPPSKSPRAGVETHKY